MNSIAKSSKNVNEVICEPTSFRQVTIYFATCFNNGNIDREFLSLDSAKLMFELNNELGFIQEIFKINNKIISIGDILITRNEEQNAV